MAFTVTKLVTASQAGGATLTTATVSVAAGSTIVVFAAVRGTSTSITSVTDQASNTYTAAYNDSSGTGAFGSGGLFYVENATALSTQTISLNLGTGTTSSQMWVFVLGGDAVGKTGLFNANASDMLLGSTTTTPPAAAVTTQRQNGAVIAWIAANNAGNTITRPGGSWVDDSSLSQTNLTAAAVHQAGTTPATYTPTFTFSPTAKYSAITAVFETTAAGAATGTGTAYDATVTTSASASPTAAAATATGTAYNATASTVDGVVWAGGLASGPGFIAVELALDSALSDDLSAATWTEITSYVSYDAPPTITRGASAEQDDAEPQTLQLRLTNADGRFTPGNPDSPYYPGITRHVPIRVRVKVAASGPTPETVATVFVGGVDEWPLGFPSRRDNYADINLRATGRWRGMLNARGQLGSLDATVRTFPLLAYWPLDEAADPSVLTDYVTGATISTPGNWTFGSTDESEHAPGLGVQTRAHPDTFGSAIYLPMNRTIPPNRRTYLLGTGTATTADVSGIACVLARPYGVESDPTPRIDFGFSGYTVRTTPFDTSFGVGATVVLYDPAGAELVNLSPEPDASFYGGSKVLAIEFYYDTDTTTYMIRCRYGNAIDSAASTLGFSPLPSWFLLKHAAISTANINGLSHVVSYVGDPTQVIQGNPVVGDPFTSPARVMQAAVEDRPYTAATEELYAETIPTRLQWLAQVAGYRTGTVTVETVDNGIVGDQPAVAGALGMGGKNALDAMKTAARAYYAPRESRDGNLFCESLQNRHNAAAWLALTFDSVQADMDPTWDDRALANQVTVTTGLGSATFIDADSQNTDGVYAKTYEAGAVASLLTGATVKPLTIAGWLADVDPGVRLSRVPLVLNRLSAANLATYLSDDPVGKRLQLTAAPTQVGSATLDLTIQGTVETFGLKVWSTVLNTVARDKYARVFVEGDATLGRLNLDHQTLAATLNTTATSVTVATAAGYPLLDTSGNDFTVDIDGEWITVTAVSGSSSPQTCTLTRSVNGVVKAHSSGATVRLATRPVLAI